MVLRRVLVSLLVLTGLMTYLDSAVAQDKKDYCLVEVLVKGDWKVASGVLEREGAGRWGYYVSQRAGDKPLYRIVPADSPSEELRQRIEAFFPKGLSELTKTAVDELADRYGKIVDLQNGLTAKITKATKEEFDQLNMLIDNYNKRISKSRRGPSGEVFERFPIAATVRFPAEDKVLNWKDGVALMIMGDTDLLPKNNIQVFAFVNNFEARSNPNRKFPTDLAETVWAHRTHEDWLTFMDTLLVFQKGGVFVRGSSSHGGDHESMRDGRGTWRQAGISVSATYTTRSRRDQTSKAIALEGTLSGDELKIKQTKPNGELEHITYRLRNWGGPLPLGM